jgi:hypothetical protein
MYLNQLSSEKTSKLPNTCKKTTKKHHRKGNENTERDIDDDDDDDDDAYHNNVDFFCGVERVTRWRVGKWRFRSVVLWCFSFSGGRSGRWHSPTRVP